MFMRRLYRHRIGFVALMTAATVIASGASARAASSVLVYSCGPGFANLCQINGDGRGQKRLTTDGSPTVFAKKYLSPSLSRDGRRLAYLRGYHLYVLTRASGRRTAALSNVAQLVRISPDGSKVGDLEQYPNPSGTGFMTNVCVFNSNAAGHEAGRNCVGSSGSLGFTNDNHVLASVSNLYDPSYDRYEKGICLLMGGCDRFVVSEMGYDLFDPAVSPDGKLLAVTRAIPGRVEGEIAVYDYRTGALVRVLTTTHIDSGPVWSPDGKRIAFVRGAGTNSPRIFTVATAGGMPRLLVSKGRAVTWGR